MLWIICSYLLSCRKISYKTGYFKLTDQDFKEKHQEFIDQVNISMKEVKTYYNVEIPDEEVEYIYNYIIND